MKARLSFAFALWFAALMLTMQFSSASGTSPPALVPIGDEQSPEPAAPSTATPKILGHEVVSAFCSTFVKRFNIAATTMLSDDKSLDEASAAETDYEDDFFRLDGAARSWNHRLVLIAAVGRILQTIPRTQSAVDELRAQAAVSNDPERRDALRESAAQLQVSIDHQRIVANELNDAIGAMLDLHSVEDTLGHQTHSLMDGRQKFNVDPGDAPVPHPGDELPTTRRAGTYGTSAIEYILAVPRDRQLGADAESNAEVAVTRVVRSCAQESSPAGQAAATPKP